MIAGILLFCGASVFTACSSDDNAVDSIDSNESEMADYAILFYGYGGGNLDYDILNNIQQFYAANPASYDKVKIAVQYKFSSQEEFEEQMVAETERLTVNALFHVMTFSTTSHGLKEAIA